MLGQGLPGETIDSTSAYEAVLGIEGVPGDITLSSSYRTVQSQFFLLPEGKSLDEYSDLDIAYMESIMYDETNFYGNTGNGAIRVINYNQPTEEFKKASVLALSHIIKYNGAYNFYDVNDSLIADRLLDSVRSGVRDEGTEIDTTKISSLEGGRIQYLNGNTKIILDTAYHSIFHEVYDSTGIWIRRRFKQFHSSDTSIHMPIYSISTHRILLPSGECAFRVNQQTAHEIYYPGSGTTGTGSGSGSLVNSETNRNILKTSIKVFPNPANNILNVAIRDKNIQEGSIQIISPDGKIVIQQNFKLKDGNVLNMDISGFAHGLYLVRIISENGMTNISKFLKQ